MPSDFTVIQSVRQRFGDEFRDETTVEAQAPFVGASKDFAFACPGVDSAAEAVLQFETRGAQYGYKDEHPRNIIRINGVDIPGGITPGPYLESMTPPMTIWKSHTLTVPANLLGERNVLHVEAVKFRDLRNQLDNFVLDNVVVFYKTRRSTVVGGTVGPSTNRRAKKAQATKKAASKKSPARRSGRR